MLVCNLISVGMCCMFHKRNTYQKGKKNSARCLKEKRPFRVNNIHASMLPKYRLLIWIQELINTCNYFFRGRSFYSTLEIGWNVSVQMRRSSKHPCKHNLGGFWYSLICGWKAFNCTYQHCTCAPVYVFAYMCVMSWCTASHSLISIQPARARTHTHYSDRHFQTFVQMYNRTHARTHTHTGSQQTNTHPVCAHHTEHCYTTHICARAHPHTPHT